MDMLTKFWQDLIKAIVIMHDDGKASKRLPKPTKISLCVFYKPIKFFQYIFPRVRSFLSMYLDKPNKIFPCVIDIASYRLPQPEFLGLHETKKIPCFPWCFRHRWYNATQRAAATTTKRYKEVGCNEPTAFESLVISLPSDFKKDCPEVRISVAQSWYYLMFADKIGASHNRVILLQTDIGKSRPYWLQDRTLRWKLLV